MYFKVSLLVCCMFATVKLVALFCSVCLNLKMFLPLPRAERLAVVPFQLSHRLPFRDCLQIGSSYSNNFHDRNTGLVENWTESSKCLFALLWLYEDVFSTCDDCSWFFVGPLWVLVVRWALALTWQKLTLKGRLLKRWRLALRNYTSSRNRAKSLELNHWLCSFDTIRFWMFPLEKKKNKTAGDLVSEESQV